MSTTIAVGRLDGLYSRKNVNLMTIVSHIVCIIVLHQNPRLLIDLHTTAARILRKTHRSEAREKQMTSSLATRTRPLERDTLFTSLQNTLPSSCSLIS